MTIESNKPQINLQDIAAAGITGSLGSVPKLPDNIRAERPKTIFSGMTKNDAEYYGLVDEYTAANTDGKEGISEAEYKAYTEAKSAQQASGKQQPEAAQLDKNTPSSVVQKEETQPKTSSESSDIKVGMTEKEAESLGIHENFMIVDRNNSKVIEEHELVTKKILDKLYVQESYQDLELFNKYILYAQEGQKKDVLRKSLKAAKKDFDEELFNRIDTDGDGVISADESKAGVKLLDKMADDRIQETNRNNIREFMKKVGETSSSTFSDLMKSIGYDVTQIDMSQVKTLSHEELSKAFNILASISSVHSGMTQEEAEKLGIHDRFSEIVAFSDTPGVIDKKSIAAFTKAVLEENDIKIEEIVKTINSFTGEEKANLLIQMTKLFSSDGAVLDDFKSNDNKPLTVNEYLGKLGIDEEQWASLPTEEKGKLLAKQFGRVAEQNMDLSNSESEIRKLINKIAQGDIPDFLVAQGYEKGVAITDPDKCLELAMKAMSYKNLSTFTQMSVQIFKDGENVDQEAMMHAVSAFVAKNSVVKNILKSIGIELSGDNRARMQEIAAQDVNEDDLKDATSAILLGSLADNAEAVEIVMQNNTDYVDYITNVTTDTIQQLVNNGHIDSGTGAQIIQNITNSANNIVVTSQSSGASGGTQQSAGGGQSVPQWTIGGDQQATQGVMDTSSMSKDYWSSQGVTDVSASQQAANQATFKLKNEMSLPQQLRYAQARIRNMEKSQIFEMVAKHFDQIPDKFKDQVINYFSQMPTGVLIDTMLSNETIQNFMFQHKFVKFEDLVTYVRKHPQLMDKNNKQMTDGLKEKLIEYVDDNKIDDLQAKTQTT